MRGWFGCRDAGKNHVLVYVKYIERTTMHGALRRSTGEYAARASIALVTLGLDPAGIQEPGVIRDTGIFYLPGSVAEMV